MLRYPRASKEEKMSKRTIIFTVFAATLIAVGIYLSGASMKKAASPLELMTRIPFDSRSYKMLTVGDNLVLYNDRGLFMAQLSSPVANETTEQIDGNIASVFYGKVSKKLFVQQNKK